MGRHLGVPQRIFISVGHKRGRKRLEDRFEMTSVADKLNEDSG